MPIHRVHHRSTTQKNGGYLQKQLDLHGAVLSALYKETAPAPESSGSQGEEDTSLHTGSVCTLRACGRPNIVPLFHQHPSACRGARASRITSLSRMYACARRGSNFHVAVLHRLPPPTGSIARNAGGAFSPRSDNHPVRTHAQQRVRHLTCQWIGI